MLKEDHKAARVSGESPYYADILEIARSFQEVKFGFTPRRNNQNAHRLSRQGASLRMEPEPEIFLGSVEAMLGKAERGSESK